MKRRKRKRRSISLLLAAILALPALAADKKKQAQQVYVLLDGTVFQESGFALPHAEVTLIPQAEPGSPAAKIKKMQTVSDSRGEFAFRLPQVSMRYVVKASAKGFRGEEKSVIFQGEDRQDVTFRLQPESK